MPKKPTKDTRDTQKQISIQDKSQTIYKSGKQLVIDNFIAGIAWGLGSVIGATLVFAVLGFVLSQTQELPFIGQIIENIFATIQNATD